MANKEAAPGSETWEPPGETVRFSLVQAPRLAAEVAEAVPGRHPSPESRCRPGTSASREAAEAEAAEAEAEAEAAQPRRSYRWRSAGGCSRSSDCGLQNWPLRQCIPLAEARCRPQVR